MKFSAAVSAAVLGFASMASAVTVKYDTGYDDAGRSMNVVACSDGPNGLAARYPTQGSIPGYPNIGSYSGIAGWNSPQCGTCWNLSFNGRTIKMMAIDHAGDGFVLSKQAMDALTGGQAQWYGTIDAQVSATSC